jgi:hypothetical protein
MKMKTRDFLRIFMTSSPVAFLFFLITLASAMTVKAQVKEVARQFETPSLPMPAIAYAAPASILSPDSTDHVDPSVAVVEYNEDGVLWNDCGPSKPTCQRDYAMNFIKQARRTIPAGDRLVVLTFVHGWLHNAQWDDQNFLHLRESVDCLNWGEAEYSRVYAKFLERPQGTESYDLSCKGVNRPNHEHFVGVYVGWQGVKEADLEKKKDDLSLNFSLKDRFTTALGTADKGPITDLFVRLGAAVKNGPPEDGQPAQLIIAGHSMGGLIVERIAAAMITAKPPLETLPCTSGDASPAAPVSFFLLINPAHNGAVGMQLIENTDFTKPCKFPNLAPMIQAPVIISVHSKSDPWTGIYGAIASHLGTPLPEITTEKIHNNEAYFERPPKNGALYHWTFNQSTYLLNLCYIDGSTMNRDGTGSATGDNVCNRIAEKIKEARSSVPNADLSGIMAFPHLDVTGQSTVLSQLYPRSDPGCHKPNKAATPGVPLCMDNITRQPGSLNLPPFNNTPYWAVNVTDSVIRGHSAFWSDEFTGLLLGLAENFK